MTLYLDANATTPLEPRVLEAMINCLRSFVGNAGSHHRFGREAKQLVHRARGKIAAAVGARRHELILTSGATESNNLALLGISEHGESVNKRHIVSTQIEHRAVLGPLQTLIRRGFDVTLVGPGTDGRVSADDVLAAVRADTLLVSVMHVNNETGICQPIDAIACGLESRPTLLHVDAAQGYGKWNEPLTHPRIDLISISAHKIHGPQGIGALIARRRDGKLPPLSPLMYGGGHEFGLRPGTSPVALIVGFGLAAELAAQEAEQRRSHCRRLRAILLQHLSPLDIRIHGCVELALPHVLNMSFAGWDADQVIERLGSIAAVSDGAACTSVCATASHVLAAMDVTPPWIDGAVRLSWSHLTSDADMACAATAMREVLTR